MQFAIKFGFFDTYIYSTMAYKALCKEGLLWLPDIK